MAAKKFARMTSALQASALEHAEPDRLFGGSRRGMRLVEPRLEDIDLNPDQPRRLFDPDALQTLADSIGRHGQKQPIGVQMKADGRWLLVFGERRYRACQMLEFATIQAVVTDGDPLEIALIENLQREELTAFETADAFAGLMERQGYNRSTLARVVGTTPSAITRLMGLRNLPSAVRREFEQGHSHISKSLLLELVDIGDEAAQAAAWEVVKGGVTVRELRELRHVAGSAPAESAISSAESQGDDSESDQMSEIKSDRSTAKTAPSDRISLSAIRLQKLLKPFLGDLSALDDRQTAHLQALCTILKQIVD
jgi:ParB family transcriptional regulator, chromosome partitioning protein